ncbi:hypothetical protein A4X13_0g5788 [Tilletia indica]|uniref:N-glycosylation protein EOS1 n=1 Tax=Tilletia indica TaxID=43049 RepID=A0A8T8SRH7_9BASI|nr:hypothetical protein A4X13_0g5788 [Tilletia indica]
MPSSSGTASAGAAPSPSPAGPRPISPTLSFASSSNRAPLPSSSSSSYFEEGRLTPSAQRAQSPTIDESAAAYFFVQQLQRHQQLQQQQQQQQQQRLYASAPSSPGLHPLRPPSRPASRSGSSRPARSRSGSNASSTSLHSLSFSSHQHSPSSSFHNLPSTLFPLTPLPPSVHQQQQQQHHLPPPLPLTLHDDLPPSYSAATASVPAVGIPSNSTVPPPHSATRSSTDEVFLGSASASASASVSRLGSGASTPSAQNPSSSRRGSSHHQQLRSQPQSNVGSPHPDAGRRHHHTADSTFQERARRNQQTPSSASSSSQWTPRGSRPGSSNGRQQQLRLSVPVFGSSAMNLAGQSSGSVNGTVHASTSTGTSVSARDSGNGNGNGRRRLQSRSEVDLSHMGRYRGLTGPSQQHIQQQEQQEGQQNGDGLRYRQRASTSGAPRPLSGTFQDASMDTARPQPPQTPIRAREGEEERTRARSRSGRQRSRRGIRSPTPTPTTTSPTPSHLLLLRLLLRILLAPIWLFTSIPHPSSSSVDDNNDEQHQPPWGWGVRMVLFPLRLFAAVPGCVGTFWLLRNMWVGLGLDGISVWDGGRGKGTGIGRIGGGGGDRKDHPTAVVFAVASLWSLSTAYYALSLTTLLLRRWLLYYSLLSSIIRLVALQAICWPLVRITLFVFGPTRPLEAWILIASTTTFSDTIARWLVSNIVEGGEGLGAWVGGGGEDGDGVFWSGTPRASPRRVVVGDEGGKVEGGGTGRRRRRSRSRSGRRRRKTTGEVGPPPLLGGTTDVDDGIEAELCMSPTEREVVKDTTDDGSGSDSSAWGANFHRRRRRRRQQGDHEGIATAASSPRRAASFPRLPTSDLLSLDIGDNPSLLCGSTGMMEPGATTLRPRSLVSAFSASSFSSSSASLSTSSSSSSTCSSEGERDVGGGAGGVEGEGFVSVDLRVRRVFHWDVAIKRNILPMGVLAYASLWVLLASSKVEGRGR